MVGRFAYIKETQYGVTWSVRIDPRPGVHLFKSGLHLQLHTDMNYRENSPGMQLLHCLKVRSEAGSGPMLSRIRFPTSVILASVLSASVPDIKASIR